MRNKNIVLTAIIYSALLIGMLMPAEAFATAAELSEDLPDVQFTAVDAPDLNSEAAALKTPVAMYEYVRNNFEFALYQGSRGGSVNTFGGQLGNDVDTASTLIAMLRSQGFPARYAVGTVKRDIATVENWLGVKNPTLAFNLLQLQGIQHVQWVTGTNNGYIQFEQVWVEVLTHVDNYRGAGSDAQTPCSLADTTCKWVPLAPAFKLHDTGGSLSVTGTVNFDYTGYYNAIKNNDADRMNKNPIDIYEKQILDYLHSTNPGKTLADVEDKGGIQQETLGLLPLSLPFEIVSSVTVRHYNSVSDHDSQAGSGKPESKPWAKYVHIDVYREAVDANGNIVDDTVYFFNNEPVLLASLATQQLTLTFTSCSGGIAAHLRLNGVELNSSPSTTPSPVCDTSGNFTTGTPLIVTLRLDGAPDPTGGTDDSIVKAVYVNDVVGGYYLIGTGGDTSNWSQVHRAAAKLLQANNNYKILIGLDPNDPGIPDPVPCVDLNQDGVVDAGDEALVDDPQAMDDLTGGLLYAAMTLYYAQSRDASEELAKLDHVVAPIDGWVGMVSSVDDVQYIDGTSYSIMPGGLLIDMKGVQFSSILRDDQPAQYDSNHFELMGHIFSSYEHETWQELTGFDAISTVRGIQMALGNGATLQDLTSSNFVSSYSAFGYNTTPPAEFTLHNTWSMFGNQPVSWGFTADGNNVLGFTALRATVNSSVDALHQQPIFYESVAGIDAFGYPMDTFDRNVSADYNRLSMESASKVDELACYPGWCAVTGLTAGQLLPVLQNTIWVPHYNNLTIVSLPLIPSLTIAPLQFFPYLDKTKGFDPASWVYAALPQPLNQYDPYFMIGLRTTMATPTDPVTNQPVTHEIVLPSARIQGPTYLFSVYLSKEFDSSNELISEGYIISNQSWLLAGGGYVDGTQFVDPTKGQTGTALNNAQLNDKTLTSLTNNNALITPSTSDPVSTVTGNMYHDETDLTIHGRGGLDYVFTRTYNSNVNGNTGGSGPLSVGWTHSYNMQLTSNDYGQFPDYPQSEAPENGNGTTSSITYTDERGGQWNYLVADLPNSSGVVTYAVMPPKGMFATLTLDYPVAGEDTLAFGNGVSYVFQGGNLKLPGNTAHLICIQDSFNNKLNFTYNDAGQLIGIADNLNISGRGGLTLVYYTSGPSIGHLQTVSDWTNRTWTYGYDAATGDLKTVTDPLGQVTTYVYQPGTHLISGVIRPATRNGVPVETQFSYYRNDRAFNYSDALGNTETLDYDLFSNSTRVTDARGFYTEQVYDNNGSLTSMREKDGGMLYFTNNPDLLRNSKQDALGYITSYTYDQARTSGAASNTHGQVTQETDPLNNTIKTDYGVLDQVTKQTDKRGNSFVYEYYDTTDPSSGAVAGKLKDVKIVSANPSSALNGIMASFTYHPSGQMAKQLETITFGSGGTQARVRTTVYCYDAQDLNVVDKYVSGSGTTLHIHYGYDTLGRLITETVYRTHSATDPTVIPLTTIIGYDNLSRPISVTDPLGNVIETLYDADGLENQRIAEYLQPDGSYVTRILYTKTYDAADRLISQTNLQAEGSGGVTQYAYDQTGNMTSQTDPNGNVTHYEYDAMGRRTAVIDANGARTTTKYDQDGHPVAVTDANGNTTTIAYDALGRPTLSTSMLNAQVTNTYDANGNSLQVSGDTVKDGSVTYDELNRPVSMQQGSATTLKTYDLLGDVTQVKDANLHATNMAYDDMGRLITVKDPLVETPTDLVTTYTYDEMGNVLTKTDRKGQVTRYTYDCLNRLVLTDFLTDGTSETRHYNVFGDLDTVSNPNVIYTYTYDNLHRLKSKADSRNSSRPPMSWSYDAAGNLIRKSDFQGDVTEYQYDSTNRLIAMSNTAYVQASYQYDKGGRLISRILSSGARTEYTYDADNKLLTLGNYANDGSLVRLYTYTRALSGLVTSIATQTSSGTTITNYTYNTQHFMTRGAGGTFVYDGVGNRTSITLTVGGQQVTQNLTYDADNRLVSTNASLLNPGGPKAYSYDADGNLTDTADSSGNPMQHLTWDQKNRLLSVNVIEASDPGDFSGGGGGTSTCPPNNQTFVAKGNTPSPKTSVATSNACGILPVRTITHLAAQRPVKAVGPVLHSNTTTQNGGNGSSTPLDTMTYDPDDYRLSRQTSSDAESYYLDGKNLDAVYDGTGTVLQNKFMRGAVIDEILYGYNYDSSGQATPAVYQHDAVTSVISESGANGQSLATFTYDAFGNVTANTGTSQSDLLYTGHTGDGDTGYYYYRARYYDPTIGRFISEDPKGFAAGVNFYEYADNDPLNENDPTGFDPPDVSNPSQDCLDALKIAGANTASLTRVVNNWSILQTAADAYGLDPSLLAAIAVRETGFRNIPQIGGGEGMGVFQIDLGANPDVTKAQASNLTFAANFAANMLSTNMSELSSDYPDLDSVQLLQATAASYNFGTDNISGNPDTIDVGTTGGNYGSNVLGLLACFVHTTPGLTDLGPVSDDTASTSTSGAAGGFVIYPNQLNLNSSQSVYKKP